MRRIIALALCCAALPAAAHDGHATASGFAAGLAHPLMGLDHLLAMLGIGMWSRRQERPLVLPMTFIAMMAAGAVLQTGLMVPQWTIAASVLLTGVLLAAVRMPQWGAVSVVALFALLHGQVHGHELPGAPGAAGYLIASAVLLMAGMAIGRGRVAGVAIAGAGMWMLAALA